jgi:cytochrome c oxidase subunit IV
MEDAIQLAMESRVAEQHRHHKIYPFFVVCGALLVLTDIEVYLCYHNIEPKRMLSILLCLSIVKAGLFICYFIHL